MCVCVFFFRNYKLRKVEVNADPPPSIKKDAHAMILEFIRSRPPLKKVKGYKHTRLGSALIAPTPPLLKIPQILTIISYHFQASERKLPPRPNISTPREKLLEDIREGHRLKHVVPKFRMNLMPTPQTLNHKIINVEKVHYSAPAPKSQQRLIRVDWSTLSPNDSFYGIENSNAQQSDKIGGNQIRNAFSPSHNTIRSNSRELLIDSTNTYKITPTSRRNRMSLTRRLYSTETSSPSTSPMSVDVVDSPCNHIDFKNHV